MFWRNSKFSKTFSSIWDHSTIFDPKLVHIFPPHRITRPRSRGTPTKSPHDGCGRRAEDVRKPCGRRAEDMARNHGLTYSLKWMQHDSNMMQSCCISVPWTFCELCKAQVCPSLLSSFIWCSSSLRNLSLAATWSLPPCSPKFRATETWHWDSTLPSHSLRSLHHLQQLPTWPRPATLKSEYSHLKALAGDTSRSCWLEFYAARPVRTVHAVKTQNMGGACCGHEIFENLWVFFLYPLEI